MEEIGLTLHFENIEKMNAYLKDMEEYQNYKNKKQMKKENDNRGKHIILYHQKAKEYHLLHPTIPYRECLKIAKNL